jgi:hypothetical protein
MKEHVNVGKLLKMMECPQATVKVESGKYEIPHT